MPCTSWKLLVIQANYMSWFLPSKSRRGKIGHRLEVELSVSQDDHVAEGQVGWGGHRMQWWWCGRACTGSCGGLCWAQGKPG